MAIPKEVPQVEIPQPKERIKKDNVTPIRPDVIKNALSNDGGVGVLRQPGIGLGTKEKKEKKGGSGGDTTKGKKGRRIIAGVTAGVVLVGGAVALEATDTINVVPGWPNQVKNEAGTNGIKTPEDAVNDLANEGIIIESELKPVEDGPAIPVKEEIVEENIEALESALTEAEKKMMPEIDGLYRTKEGDEYVYKALSSNEYGLEAGENSGGFKEEVYMQNFSINEEGFLVYNEGDVRKSGGVFFVSSVVEKIAIEMEDSYLHKDTFELVPIPVDISSIDAGDKIMLSIDNDLSGPEKIEERKMGSLKIELSKSLPLVNICHNVSNFSVFDDRDTIFIINDFIKGNWQSKNMVPNTYGNLVYFNLDSLNLEDIGKTFVDLEYGDQITETGTDIYIANMIDNGENFVYSRLINLDSSNGEVPLFIKAND